MHIRDYKAALPPHSNARWKLVPPALLHWFRSPLHTTVLPVYHTMLRKLQRDMLIMLLIIGIPISVLFGIQLFYNTFGDTPTPPLMFIIHIGRVLGLLGCAVWFLRRDNVEGAWISILLITQGTLLFQVWLLREPGVLIFGLFSLIGPAIIFPFLVNLGITGTMLVLFYSIIHFAFPNTPLGWLGIALFFGSLMFGFACIGLVIRRVIRHFASVVIENEQAAATQAQLKQRMDDLVQHVDQLASLEHDLRQPLRSVQGYLTLLGQLSSQAEQLSAPALAAAGRAERLFNNLLDQTRAEAAPIDLFRQQTDLHQFFAALQLLALGLARYYTEPPVPIQFRLEHLPIMTFDAPQVERALLNLLDNALSVSPADGVITIHVWGTAMTLCIDVTDQGPGIPPEVLTVLHQQQPYSTRGNMHKGLGLHQVRQAVGAHGGQLYIKTTPGQTTMRLEFPLK